MKKTADIITIAFILLIFKLTKDINILSLTISFSMYLLYSSIFSTTSIKNTISKYHNEKNYYKRDLRFKYSILTILLIGIILTIISYYIGNLLSIDKINIINIFMTIAVISNTIIKIMQEYLEVVGYKKISSNLLDIYRIVVLIIEIIASIMLFKIFKLDNYINFSILYLINILTFIILAVTLHFLIFKKIKKHNPREKEKILPELKKIIITDKTLIIYNIVKNSYIYISIILLYYILTNKYNYNYQTVGTLISNTYFYGLIVAYYIFTILDKKLNINYKDIKNTFNNNINKIIKITLNVSILLLIISNPISNILLENDYNFVSTIVPVLFIYIIYNYIINLEIIYIKDTNALITLVIGLIIKILFELPLISTIYRMGYSLVLGSILSTILGLGVSIILGLIFIKNKFKLNLLNNFNDILNITYESIIYTLVLVIFTLIVKVDTKTLISSILVITFYIFITILFHIIERILTKK